MPLVTSKEMLSKAQKEGYAVGAFNAENMEMEMCIRDSSNVYQKRYRKSGKIVQEQ